MKLPPDSYQIETARRQDIIRRAEQEQLAEIARGPRNPVSRLGTIVASLVNGIRRITPGVPSPPPRTASGEQQQEIAS